MILLYSRVSSSTKVFELRSLLCPVCSRCSLISLMVSHGRSEVLFGVLYIYTAVACANKTDHQDANEGENLKVSYA